eukprot:m.69975 g.69975  ORF g.69975 m.69975 type:complete len:586 (+) comp14279_c0_seq1:63-1820(+)
MAEAAQQNDGAGGAGGPWAPYMEAARALAANAQGVLAQGLALAHKAVVATNALLQKYEPLAVAVIAVALYVVVTWLWDHLFCRGPLLHRFKVEFFRVAKKIPFVRNKVDESIDKAMVTVRKSMLKRIEGVRSTVRMPESPASADDILRMLQKFSVAGDFEKRRKEGRVNGTIYVGGRHYEDLTKLVCEAFNLFTWTNPLHTGIFPGLRQMEAEIVAMTISVFGGNDKTCGVLTSGGTESILMALKAYRDRAAEDEGITRPNIVMPRTCHPAFSKACQYFNIEMRYIHEDPVTFRADVAAMDNAIDGNTICLIGSCPQYPHGAVDPIEELGKVALKHHIGLHVDCCLGSFVVAFLQEAGEKNFPKFDFRVPGVTSISADTHKYGYTPKGSSVIMYSTPELRKYQFSVFPDWPGGIYGTPSMAGSRPGALIAGTWAAMMFHGKQRYIDNARTIMKSVHKLADGIKKIKGLRLVVEPPAMVVSFTSDSFDINRLLEPMEKCGWDLGVLQFPSCIHIGITMAHTEEAINQLLADLRRTVTPLMDSPHLKVEGVGAMYGMAQSLPDRSIVDELVRATLGTVYATESKKEE